MCIMYRRVIKYRFLYSLTFTVLINTFVCKLVLMKNIESDNYLKGVDATKSFRLFLNFFPNAFFEYKTVFWHKAVEESKVRVRYKNTVL